MAKSKETQLGDLSKILMEVSDELRNIGNELEELNSSLSTIGTMVTINMLVDKQPQFKDKLAPIINELIKGLEMTLSEKDDEMKL